VPSPAKGVPARFVSVEPAAAAKASSEGWRLCLRPNRRTEIRAMVSTDLYMAAVGHVHLYFEKILGAVGDRTHRLKLRDLGRS
jgi:hypothetical protein